MSVKVVKEKSPEQITWESLKPFTFFTFEDAGTLYQRTDKGFIAVEDSRDYSAHAIKGQLVLLVDVDISWDVRR